MKIRRKTTMDRAFLQNLSCHVSLCNLDGSVKNLKLLCGVWKEVMSKSANDFESCFMIVCTIDEDDVFYEGCRRLVEEHRHIG